MANERVMEIAAVLDTYQKPTDYALGLCNIYSKDLEMALNNRMVSDPRGGPLSMDSFLAAVKLEVSRDEKLQQAMQASPASMLKCLLLAAQCKLLPGATYHLFYLIPRWNGRAKRLEVTPLIGYKGLSDMALRHPRVHKVEAHLVYEGEKFSWNPGKGELSHEVNILGDRGPDMVIGGYARVVLTDPAGVHPILADPVVHLMNRDEIDAIMMRSDSWAFAEKNGRRDSPWHTDWKPMARKTLIRAVMSSGRVPMDMGLGGALSTEAEAERSVAAAATDPVDSVEKSQNGRIRAALGLAKKFDFAVVEEALAAVDSAEDAETLAAIRAACDRFQGADADAVDAAIQTKTDALK